MHVSVTIDNTKPGLSKVRDCHRINCVQQMDVLRRTLWIQLAIVRYNTAFLYSIWVRRPGQEYLASNFSAGI